MSENNTEKYFIWNTSSEKYSKNGLLIDVSQDTPGFFYVDNITEKTSNKIMINELKKPLQLDNELDSLVKFSNDELSPNAKLWYTVDGDTYVIHSGEKGANDSIFYVESHRNIMQKIQFTKDANKALIDVYATGLKLSNCPKLISVIGVENLNFSNSTSLEDFFSGCTKLVKFTHTSGTDNIIDLSYIESPNVITTTENMFLNCSSITDVISSNGTSEMDFSKLTTATSMFQGCSNLKACDLASTKYFSPTYVNQMFSGCTSLTQVKFPDSALETSVNLEEMFKNCTELTTINILDKSSNNLYLTNADTTNNMFYGCVALKTLCPHNLGKLRYANGMFCNCSSLEEVSLQSDISVNFGDSLIQADSMFESCVSLTSLVLGNKSFPQLVRMNKFLYGCKNLPNSAISSLIFNKIQYMSESFAGCEKLESVSFSSSDFSSLVSVSGIFKNCIALDSVTFAIKTDTVTPEKTTNLTSISEIFSGCEKLTRFTWDGLVTTYVTDFSAAFKGCKSLNTLKTYVTDWDIVNATDLSEMFADTNISEFTPGKDFKISSNRNVICDKMFYNCANLSTADLKTFWVYSGSISNQYMFSGCTKLTDVDLDKMLYGVTVCDLDHMFSGCTGLSAIYIKFHTGNTNINFSNAFYGCTGLILLTFDTYNSDTTIENAWYLTQSGQSMIEGVSEQITVVFNIQKILYITANTFRNKSTQEVSTTVPIVFGGKATYSLYKEQWESILTETPVKLDEFGASGEIIVSYNRVGAWAVSSVCNRLCLIGFTSSLPNYSEASDVPWATKMSYIKFLYLFGSMTNVPAYCCANASYLETVHYAGAKSLTTIGKYAYSKTGLSIVEIPSSIETIGAYAFLDSVSNQISYEDITTSALKSIGDGAFEWTLQDTTQLNFVAIPSTVKEINSNAFAGQTGLNSTDTVTSKVRFYPTTPPSLYGSNQFPTNAILTVPNSSYYGIESYQKNWKMIIG